MEFNFKRVLTHDLPPLHRFVGFPPTEFDYYVGTDGMVKAYDDPAEWIYSNKNKVPKRGISFFTPVSADHNTNHGKPKAIQNIANVNCFRLGTSTIQDTNWRLRYVNEIGFYLDDQTRIALHHFIMYSSVSLSTDAFTSFDNQFPWLPCALTASVGKLSLRNEEESEEGQDPTVVCALQLVQTVWNMDDGAFDRILLCDLHDALSTHKKPLQYHHSSRLNFLQFLATRAGLPEFVLNQQDHVRHEVFKALKLVNSYCLNIWCVNFI